jgi:glucokinase
MVLNAPNLPGWVDFPLRSLVEQALGVPVAIGNDANLAALAEWKFGAGRGTQDMIYITVSTGVGGGVISRGRLISGARGLGAELGHMVADPHGPVCSCGRPGHLEAIASGPAIVRRAADLLHQGNASTLRLEIVSDPALTPEVIAQAARQGDGLARQVVREAGEALGRQLASLVHVFNPQVIVVGGGVAQIGEALFAAIQVALRASTMHPAFLDGLEVRPAALGDDSGLVGAMILASEA